MTIQEIRALAEQLRKAGKPINPDGTYTMEKRVWEKLLELADVLQVPENPEGIRRGRKRVSMALKKGGAAGNARESR